VKAFTVARQVRPGGQSDLWVVVQWNDWRDPQIIGQWSTEYYAIEAAQDIQNTGKPQRSPRGLL